MRRFVLTLLLFAAPLVAASERAADPDELRFLGEFTALQTGLLPSSMGDGDDSISWDELDATQREILAEVAEGWAERSDEERWWLTLGAIRWSGMRGSDRRQVDDRLRAWRRLTVVQQQRVRTNLARYSALDENQRLNLRERLRDFSRMTPVEQQRLREAYETMSEEERSRLRERIQQGMGSVEPDPDRP